MKLAVIGATGLVGTVMRKVLEERRFPVTDFIPVASARSVGKALSFYGKSHTIESMEQAVAARPAIAIFSAGGSVSKEWAPRFAANGTTVIDNSSAWRMDPDKKLIVPEINANLLTREDKIIANPNCSTIQMVVALGPLHRRYGIRRLVIATYQSITGTGMKAVRQYESEKAGSEISEKAYPHPIFDNCIPHCDIFLDNDYTKEEMKLVNETRKILDDQSLAITATAVRVPVHGGHSEAVNVEFNTEYDLDDVKTMLAETPGVRLVDEVANHRYPMPLFAKGRDEVFVGRLRRDESQSKTLNMWVVADNLRKGAATNAIQIAEYLLEQGMIGTARMTSR